RGRLDVPLNARGHRQAARLAADLVEVSAATLAASPLLRARSTAYPIAAATGLSVTVLAGLADRDYGPWSGVGRRVVEVRFGSVDAAPGVEQRAGFELRVLGAIADLMNGPYQ